MSARSKSAGAEVAAARVESEADAAALEEAVLRLQRPVEAYLLPPKTSLSTPALEALAIVAHLQPVTKSEVEAIRGVNSDSVVTTLLDRNLIEEAGRKDVVGRPMQYRTTPFFLESFGLRSLDDLPELELEPGQPLELNLLASP